MANEKNIETHALKAAFQKYDNSLASVAISGDYSDLSNTPPLMTAAEAEGIIDDLINARSGNE